MHSLTVADLLRSHALSYPQQTASVYGQRRHSYPQLQQRTTQLASALLNNGIGAGGRLLWLGQNSDRLLELVLAAAKLGAIICPANWRLSSDELVGIIDDMQPHAVFWQQEEINDNVQAARTRSGNQGLWLRADGIDADDEYEALLAKGDCIDREQPVDPDSPLLQIYTAAFTGKPRGALLSHRAILAQSLMLAMLQDIDSRYVFLNSGPLFHVGTWMATWPTFLMAGTNVFARRVEPEELCRLIDAERCTGAFLVSSTQQQMVEINKDGRYNLKSLHGHSGSPEWNAMITPGESRWYRQFSGYGQSETLGLIAFNGLCGPSLGGSGRASPLALVRIFDEEGRDMPAGEVGEIVVRGPTVMNGYYRHGEAPEQRTLNGWHRTNDLGRREADGSISFIGPKQRMIKSGVENIYPAELEKCIRELPGVRDCAIIGIPDAQWIQTVKAIVVLERDDAQSEASIIEHCRSRLASYKKPRAVVFVDSIPKIGFAHDYDKLDNDFGGGNYPGSNTRSR